MKWVSVNNNSSQESFELWEDEKKLANISFSKQTRFVRVVSSLGKRMFSFDIMGLFHPRKIIRNEYGVKLGKLEMSKSDVTTGSVMLEDKKYLFEYNQHNSGELTLYDELKQNNLLTCSINSITLGLNKTKSLLDSHFTSLLLVLCWYSFQPENSAVTEIM